MTRSALSKGEMWVERVCDLLTAHHPDTGDHCIAASMHMSNFRISERYCADVVTSYYHGDDVAHMFLAVCCGTNAGREVTKLLSRDRDTTPHEIDLVVWPDRGKRRGAGVLMLRRERDRYALSDWLDERGLIDRVWL